MDESLQDHYWLQVTISIVVIIIISCWRCQQSKNKSLSISVLQHNIKNVQHDQEMLCHKMVPFFNKIALSGRDMMITCLSQGAGEFIDLDISTQEAIVEFDYRSTLASNVSTSKCNDCINEIVCKHFLSPDHNNKLKFLSKLDLDKKWNVQKMMTPENATIFRHLMNLDIHNCVKNGKCLNIHDYFTIYSCLHPNFTSYYLLVIYMLYTNANPQNSYQLIKMISESVFNTLPTKVWPLFILIVFGLFGSQREHEKNNASNEYLKEFMNKHQAMIETQIRERVPKNSIYTVKNGLVVILGIGEIYGYPDLAGVPKDYANIINTFKKYNYAIFYKSANNESIYSNDKNVFRQETEYKLKWQWDEIDSFLVEARYYVVCNDHDALLFFISGHGDVNDVLHDSDCGCIQVQDEIVLTFHPEAVKYLESHQETEIQTKRLFAIPKIFFIDMCRGKKAAKVTQTVTGTSDINDDIKDVTIESKYNDQQQQSEIDCFMDESKISETDSSATTAKTEKFTLKTVDQETADKLYAQTANFYSIYATSDSCLTADGSVNGGLFTRNVCRVFNDLEFVSDHTFDEIALNIRNGTKLDSTICGNLKNFTQVVPNESTLEKPVKFAFKYT